MGGMLRGALMATIAGLAALAMIAVPSVPSFGQGSSTDELVVAYYQEPDSLNYYASQVLGTSEMGVREGFTSVTDKMKYIPKMVQRVPEVSNGDVKIAGNKMVVTWRLRPDLQFSDGKPATSADAKFTWQAVNNPSFRVFSRAGWTSISSIDTPDPQTVIATFDEPYVAYNDLFRSLLPKHFLEGKDLNTYLPYNRFPLTTGPFAVRQWVAGQYITATANTHYRDAAKGLPKLKKITWRFVSDSTTRINMLKSGQAHVAWAIPFEDIEAMKATPGIKVIVYPVNAWMHFDFQMRRPMFQDVRLRQAVAYAIDKNSIVRNILGGHGTVAGPPITPLSWAYNPNAYRQYTFNPQRARELIAEAGYTAGPDGIVQKDGRPLAFNNCNRTGDITQDRVQQAIQSMLRSVGMNMEIRNYSPTVYTAIRFRGECDTLFHRWIVPPAPFLSNFYATQAIPPNGLNTVFYVNEQLTAIVNEAERTLDQRKARPLFWRAQEILAQDLPTIPIYYTMDAHASTSRLQGLLGNPTNDGAGWNIADWMLTK
jgi:peptide/nickel transport system substrate-binding protein